ncbi:MAG: DNA repair protein RadA [Candidatus Omnitrophica bacterium]|jgi:DNA repair protein RadA/Sms|nr:DNA repair protein RadA [Candidatus Omnitrophota bacterium]
MKKSVVFSCSSCGFQSPKWLGKCPDCGKWNSFIEEDYQACQSQDKQKSSLYKEGPVLLKELEKGTEKRIKTGIAEFDRVLGGGLVAGSVVLIGGDPGIGKSTIALQVCCGLAVDKKVLYVSAEESVVQSSLRAARLGEKFKADKLYIVNQTDLSLIVEYINKIKPDVVVVDSVQVIFDPNIGSASGSVAQVRECAGMLTQIAKAKEISLFIIGHVTKDGSIAGPRVLEHIVDTVLYFEGDRFSAYRILRAVKNRFGSTNEIGVFEMTNEGLKQVANPSEIFLAEKPKAVAGSVVTSVLEGTRPLLVEIQALVSKSSFGYALRRSQGFDANRLNIIIAVLEKKIGFHLELEDIFINVAGGMEIDDAAADLAVAVAIASSFKDKVVPEDAIFLGEVGLSGEVRSIAQVASRINEASRLGFKRCFISSNMKKGTNSGKFGLEIIPVSSLKQVLDIILK